MNLPYRFPREADVIYEDAQAFRRLTPTERFFVLLDLIASGTALLEQSPHKEVARRLQEAQETEWQNAYKALFARHRL